MKKGFILPAICLLLITGPLLLNGQKPDSVLSIYAAQFQQEKMYLQFDKPVYNQGDMIWFKAYLLAGTELTDYSTDLYIDWYDQDGRLIRHTTAPIISSSAKGQFLLPDNYEKEVVYVKAYTRWMLNFDSGFLYQKTIPIIHPKNANLNKPSKPASAITVDFFPEGGDLVNGITSRLAFKAVNGQGMPVEISGVIKNNSGEIIDSFRSEHDGMGIVFIEPKLNESYTASCKDESGSTFVSQMPNAKLSGVTMEVYPAENKSLVTLHKSLDADPDLKNLHLIAHMHQFPVFRADINMGTSDKSSISIPTGSLPTGILQVTLFTADWLPLAERIVFVNNHDYSFAPQINITEKNLSLKGMNTIEIAVPDSIPGNLSIAVTDAGLSADHNSIFSQLLLCSDLKGYIHHPDYYFADDHDSIAAQLDLVMLTNGWRRFNWKKIVQGQLPVISLPRDTTFIAAYGTLLKQKQAQKTEDNILLMLQSKDSSQHIYTPALQKNGSFIQQNLFFYDTIKAFIQNRNTKQFIDKNEFTIKTDLLNGYPATLSAKLTGSSQLTGLVGAETVSTAVFYAKEQEKFKSLSRKPNDLPGVTVKTKTKKPIDLMDENYTSGLFRGDGKKIDIMHDPMSNTGMNIFDYLKNKVAGLIITTDYADNSVHLVWRSMVTDVYLNEFSATTKDVQNLSMSDIAYIKIFEPGSSTGTANVKHVGGSPGGAIAIYTKKGDDELYTPALAVQAPFQLLEGYTAYTEFYTPDYTLPNTKEIPDTRTTLYWNPYIITNAANRTVRLSFYKNDYSKKLRIILEGINQNGKLARVEKLIE